MMAISTYYRGRLSFNEVLDMPIDRIQTLNYLIYKNKDDQKELKAAEAMEDNLEQIIT